MALLQIALALLVSSAQAFPIDIPPEPPLADMEADVHLSVKDGKVTSTPIDTRNDWQKLTGWLSTQNPKAGTMVDFATEFSPVLYLRGVSYGQKGINIDPEKKQYFDFNLGIITPKTESIEPLVLIMAHPSNLMGPLSRMLPFRTRLKLPTLPDIEMGPAVRLPMPNMTWTIRSSIGFVVAVRI